MTRGLTHSHPSGELMDLNRPFLFLFAFVVLPTAAERSLGADLVKTLPNSSQFQLSNLRQEQDDFGNQVLVFDFKRTKQGKPSTYFVKGKTDRGPLAISAVLPGFQPSGNMRLRSMFPSSSNTQINLELYVTSMHTVGEKAYVYSMVSNSIRIGNPGVPTRPREWSVQEKEGYEKHLREKPKTIKRYEITADLPSDSVKVPLSAKLTKGLGLKACYQSKWSPITALAENADGSVFVRWDEWGPTYDCNMLRSELLISKKELSTLSKHPDSYFQKVPSSSSNPEESVTSTQKPRKDYPVSISVPKDSQFVPDDVVLPDGTPLQACYASKWNPITHLSNNPDGTLTVRWDDYGPAFDCSMLRSQLIIKKSALRGSSARDEKPIIDRLWTDATGKFKVQAKLIESTSTMVTLLTEAGKTVKLPVSKLSEADQNFLSENSSGDINPFE